MPDQKRELYIELKRVYQPEETVVAQSVHQLVGLRVPGPPVDDLRVELARHGPHLGDDAVLGRPRGARVLDEDLLAEEVHALGVVGRAPDELSVPVKRRRHLLSDMGDNAINERAWLHRRPNLQLGQSCLFLTTETNKTDTQKSHLYLKIDLRLQWFNDGLWTRI